MSTINALQAAFDKALANDAVVSPTEWAADIKPLFTAAIAASPNEIDPALQPFLDTRRGALHPKVFSEIDQLLTASSIKSSVLPHLARLSLLQQAQAGALLALGGDSQGVTDTEWFTAYNQRLSPLPGLVRTWRLVGATGINIFLWDAAEAKTRIGAATLKHLDNPDADEPQELSKRGVNPALVQLNRQINASLPPLVAEAPAPAAAAAAAVAPAAAAPSRDRARGDRNRGRVEEELE